ncbi:MAG TPA: hypothetical protein VK766_04105 [Cytophagaceae bacterium]|jgi:hypothetical protein|nr:hypothetical protein [Cytophagaceae bacterium]
MDYLETKNILFHTCLDWLENKIAIASKAMKDAQESANREEKSSAGDKYETGRAMSQNERDMHARQLAECLKQKQLLLSLNITKKHERVSSGALVKTDAANYFISISAGSFVIEKITYFAVSPDTPVALLMMNKKEGETFLFNKSKNSILKIS